MMALRPHRAMQTTPAAATAPTERLLPLRTALRLLAAASVCALSACAYWQPNLSPGNLSMGLVPNIDRLPSGVVVEHLREGTGVAPSPNSEVRLYYRGVLPDGKVFDSQEVRGAPGVFALGRVIPCWEQGLPKIKTGGKARISCPAATAYGAKGVPGVVPPNTPLTFDIDLVAIVK